MGLFPGNCFTFFLWLSLSNGKIIRIRKLMGFQWRRERRQKRVKGNRKRGRRRRETLYLFPRNYSKYVSGLQWNIFEFIYLFIFLNEILLKLLLKAFFRLYESVCELYFHTKIKWKKFSNRKYNSDVGISSDEHVWT